jgi:hypothetical protein
VLSLCSSFHVQRLFFFCWCRAVKNPASIFFTAAGVPHFSFSILEPRLHISIALQSLREAIATGQAAMTSSCWLPFSSVYLVAFVFESINWL